MLQSRVIYDSYGRPSSSISVHGATTTYTYDYLNRATTATINGRWTKTTTDGLGRTIKVGEGRRKWHLIRGGYRI
ncbi:MAG: hypothetical protein U0V70_15845 [Terriglobia bacterium]